MSDRYVSDVVVMLDELSGEQTVRVVDLLRAAGMEISRVNDEQSIVEGSIDAAKAHDLNLVEHVRYVRSVFTYLANYPPGDPRDTDGL